MEALTKANNLVSKEYELVEVFAFSYQQSAGKLILIDLLIAEGKYLNLTLT